MGQTPEARVVGCSGHLRFEQRYSITPRRIDVRLHDLFGLRQQLLPFDLGNGVRHFLRQRRDEGILDRRRGGESLHLLDGRMKNEPRREDSACSDPARFRRRFPQADGDLAKCGDIVFGVALGLQRMNDRERRHQTDIHALELIEREAVLQERLCIGDGLELPSHQIGRDALGLGHRRAVEGAQRCKALPGPPNARLPMRERPRGELALEAVLLDSAEVAGRACEVRIVAHPFRAELAEEILDGLIALLLRGELCHRRHRQRCDRNPECQNGACKRQYQT